MNITAGHIAFIDYKLFGLDDKLLYSEDMFPYFHGETDLLNGMIKALEGKAVGDVIDVTMSVLDSFGKVTSSDPIIIRKDDFGPAFEQLRLGASVISQDDDAQFYVQRLTSEFVVLSRNHPLAGRELRFQAHIKHIRAASAEEMAIGYPLGLDGISTSSGSCSCC